MSTLEEVTAPSFPRDQYLLDPLHDGQRVSSWVDGRQRALMFFWERPTDHRVQLVRTQAPFFTENLQRFLGTTVDGRFGELTRRALIAYGNAHGQRFPANTPAFGPLLGYGISAMFGGGRVGFPPAMDFPDTNRPVLATNPERRRYSTITAMDVDSGQETPLVVGPGGVEPVPVPPPTIAPRPPAQTHQLAPGQAAGQGQVGDVTNIYAPTNTSTASTSTSTSTTNILSGNSVSIPGFSPDIVGLQGGVPGVPSMPLDIPPPFQSNPFLRPLPPSGVCPKGFVPVGDGTCKLEAFVRFDGYFLLPNVLDLPVEFGKPDTYALVFDWLKKSDDKAKDKGY
jgi:hypothetical protein